MNKLPADEKVKKDTCPCPTCEGPRIVEILHRVTQKPEWLEDDIGPDFNWSITTDLLQCAGCETVFYRATRWDEDMVDHSYHPVTRETITVATPEVTYFPVAQSRRRPGWLHSITLGDLTLFRILSEAYGAYDGDLPILTAIGIRTAFDRASEVLKINPSLPFVEKLKELFQANHINKAQHDLLGELVDAGSAAAHRAWTPSRVKLITMFDVLEGFIHASIILPSMAGDLKKGVPPKPARRKPPSTKPKKIV